ncbi:MAG: DNA topoisomerase, partial [Bacteroides sp.]
DHHAIIPTGRQPQGLTQMEQRVFDLVARRFIAAFYPDCRFASTTVMGQAGEVEFKATGRQVLDAGWRTVFATPIGAAAQEGANAAGAASEEENQQEEEKTLPSFTKGESGPHVPSLTERWTQPPRPYTEATLLRAMETAGKLVTDDELRDALKENGIGRPSTRAAIIETLFKRNYIRKEKKNLIATPTGVELIGLIHEELLKSAELTGQWEKKLREIERRTFTAPQFLEELKSMVQDIVYKVLSDNTNRRITIIDPEAAKSAKGTKAATGAKAATSGKTAATSKTAKAKRSSAEKASSAAASEAAASSAESAEAAATPSAPASASAALDELVGKPCPLCGKGIVIKGRTAYGCSEWRNGCTWRQPFDAS